MQSYLIELLYCSVTTTVIAALFKLLTPRLIKRFRAQWCYYAWILIVIGLIIPFRPRFKRTLLELPPASEIFQLFNVTVHSDLNESRNQDYTAMSANISPGTERTEKSGVSIRTVITAVWAAGAGLYFSAHMIRHIRFARSVRRWSRNDANDCVLDLLYDIEKALGIHTDIDVAICRYVNVPLMIGFMHPRIILPVRDYSISELSIIFKHELTHYKHKDIWIKLLSILAISIHWFNPTFKYLLKEMSTVCEIACDDAVLRNADMNERKRYSMAILNSVRNSKSMTAFTTAFSTGPKKLYKRIGVIMTTQKRTTGVLIFLIVIVCTVSFGMAFSVRGDALENDYIGETNVKGMIANGTRHGDNSTDHYITDMSIKSESESVSVSNIFSDQLYGAYVTDLRYRYSFGMAQKDKYGKICNTEVFFDYDFTLLDYISYIELNQLIGAYLTYFKNTFVAASFDEVTQEDNLFLILKECKEYIEQYSDSRFMFRYYLSGMISDAPISVPFERISHELNYA
jgi:beta-lactamase regulating signal transducer with metallopeptidase domain